MTFTRRRLLTTSTALLLGSSLPGCISQTPGANDSHPDGPATEASFFVFSDITANVSNGVGTSNLLVPVGQHGHGWEPGPKVRERIHSADLLVHGMPGFQPWVDAILEDIDTDSSDVTPLDITTDLELLEAATDHGHDEPSADGHEEDDHEDEEHDEEQDDDHDDEQGQDQGSGLDPHFWMDPLRVKHAATTINDTLQSLDPTNQSPYADNTHSYHEQLDDLHTTIQTTIADATTNVLFIAGHNAYNYLADRYNLSIATLTNLSPDDRPTPHDIQRAQDIIDTHNLQYICADPLEPRDAATQLVAETDAEAVLDITAFPGLTADWEEKDWGYVDIMKNVNLPTLERALNP